MHVIDITIVQVNSLIDIYYSQSLINNIRLEDDAADGRYKKQQDTLDKKLKESGKV